MLEIEAIKTNHGYFIHQKGHTYGGSLKEYWFDGVKPLPTFNEQWSKIDKPPVKITKEQQQQFSNHRYELIDPTLVSEKIPLSLPYDVKSEEDYDQFKPEWNHLYSLYKLAYDTQPPLLVDVPFNFNIIYETDEIKGIEFSYPASELSFGRVSKTWLIENKDIQNYLLDTIICPNILLSLRTSKLTSKQSFDIICEHIRRNIDTRYASISSDYSFHFAVNKQIRLCNPEPYQKDISKFGAKKPKYVTDYRTTREIKVLDISPDKDQHGGKMVKGFEASNVEELKKLIDRYLKELMEHINKPLIDCKECEGTGVILEKEQNKND